MYVLHSAKVPSSPPTKMSKLVHLPEYIIRITLCVLVALLYEYHWLNKDFILGYLWILNHFRVKGEEVDDLYDRMINEDYPFSRSILTNAYVALTLFIIGKKMGFIRPTCLRDVLSYSFWICILFYNLHLPIMFTTHRHWQPYMHDHIHGFFILFSMNVVINVKPGRRIRKLVGMQSE